jgi:hypothetical protein
MTYTVGVATKREREADMNETYAVYQEGRQIFAGTKEECEAVARNRNACCVASYVRDGKVIDSRAQVAYLGD